MDATPSQSSQMATSTAVLPQATPTQRQLPRDEEGVASPPKGSKQRADKKCKCQRLRNSIKAKCKSAAARLNKAWQALRDHACQDAGVPKVDAGWYYWNWQASDYAMEELFASEAR